MKASRRTIILIFACISVIFLLCASIALFVIRSQWFENYVRLRIVSTIEKTTGGKAGLRSFAYDWRTLSVDMRGFVLHGSEPASGPPLFEAKRIHLGLKVVAILRKDIDIRDLLVDEPEVYLLVNPDSSTNLPRPLAAMGRRDSVGPQIIELAIQHFELNRGTLEFDNRRFALDLRGNRLRANIAYNPLLARYSGWILSPQISMRSAFAPPFTANISTHFVFASDRAEFDKTVIALGRTRVEGRATITSFANAHVSFDLNGTLEATETARLMKIPGVSAGTLALTGSGSYAGNNYSFKGSLDGRDFAYRENSFALSGISVSSLLAIDNHRLSLSGLRAKAAGAAFTGDLSLKDLRDLSFSGQFKGLSTREAGSLFIHRPLPWVGYASGRFRVSGDTEQWPLTAELSLTADIVPGSRGIPVSGQLEASYSAKNKSLRLGDSRLKLLNSTLELGGTVGGVLNVTLDTTDLQDLEPAIAFASPSRNVFRFPLHLVDQGHLHFEGSVAGDLSSPSIQGHLAAERLRYHQFVAATAESTFAVNSQQLTVTGLTLTQGSLRASASGEVALAHWRPGPSSNIHLHANIQGAEIQSLWKQLARGRSPWLTGTVNAAGDVAGTIDNPSGTATITAAGIASHREHIDSANARLLLAGDLCTVERGSVRVGTADLTFHGGYRRSSTSWHTGRADFQLDSDRFEIEDLATVRHFEPGLTGRAQVHLRAAANVSSGRVTLQSLAGGARITSIAVDRIPYGDLVLSADTENGDLKTMFSGNLRDCRFDGSSRVQLKGDYRGEGSLKFSPLKFSTIKALIPSRQRRAIPFDGLVQGETSFHGPFATPSGVAGSIRISQFQVNPQLTGIASGPAKPPAFFLQNAGPVLIDYLGQTLTVRSLRLTGADTTLSASGQIAFNKASPFDLTLNGSLNLQAISLFDQTLQAKGISRVNASITGTLSAPILTGSLEIQDSSIYADAFTNGLDHVNGLIRFDRNRATIQRLSGQSGGGHVAVGGFVSFGGAEPVSYRLQASADAVRFRYNGISVTSNADLRYNGTSENSLLSGNVTVTKAAFNPNTDVGSLFTSSSTPIITPSTETGLLHRVRLEVDVQSASTLELTTSLSQDVQAEIDLRLRGTPDRPIVLGRVSVNEGQIQFFGSKYTINRGEVNFVNPVKIEPVLDLDLQTQARGVTVNITISGTLDKLNISYRSDPPLQSSEIIALLATGRTPGATSGLVGSQSTNQNNALAAGANTILGSTVSPVSGRLQRFFGITHLKIDPMLQGIENVPQARVTMEQQISRDVTVTYVTNLSRTSQQIFRFEWALSRVYSLVAIRDENGLFGVDLQYKKRFR